MDLCGHATLLGAGHDGTDCGGRQHEERTQHRNTYHSFHSDRLSPDWDRGTLPTIKDDHHKLERAQSRHAIGLPP